MRLRRRPTPPLRSSRPLLPSRRHRRPARRPTVSTSVHNVSNWGGLLQSLRALALFGVIVAGLGFTPAEAELASDIVGHLEYHTVKQGEILYDLARSNDIGILDLKAANPGVDPWIPKPGSKILVPTAHILPDVPRKGLVLNLAELRLYYFSDNGQLLQTHAIGIGRSGWETPTGTTKIVRKKAHPTWYLTKSERAEHPEMPPFVPPGPDNPMGDFAMYLGWPLYAIHGTNKPDGVGSFVSHGCIRLYPEAIDELWHAVPLKTPVRVIDDPVMFGWYHGELFVEIHPSREQYTQLENGNSFTEQRLEDNYDTVVRWAGPEIGRVNWYVLKDAETRRSGVPVQITSPKRNPVSLFERNTADEASFASTSDSRSAN
jgi:L,D-transpeptidase ErfK/SrfK